MSVTLQKLVLMVGGLVLGVGGGWMVLRSRAHHHHPPRPTAAAVAPAPGYQVVPFAMLPPLAAVTGTSAATATPPKPEPGVPAPARWSMPDDEAAMAAIVPPAMSERLALHEGRGRFGRLRPARMEGRIRPPTSEAAAESTVSPVPSDAAPSISSTGVLAPGVLERTINGHRADIRACERKRGAGSQPGAKLSLRWTVLPDGRTQDVRVSDGNVDDEVLSRCVVDRVSRWRFEAPEGGGSALVASTFVFQ